MACPNTLKECLLCHDDLPASAFRIVDQRSGRRRSWCKACEAADKAEKRRATQVARLRTLSANTNRLFAAAAYHEFSRAIAETARAFGGAAGFARAFWATHQRAVEAGDYRAALRLDRLFLQAATWHSQTADLACSDGRVTLSDDELERAIEERIAALAAMGRGDSTP